MIFFAPARLDIKGPFSSMNSTFTRRDSVGAVTRLSNTAYTVRLKFVTREPHKRPAYWSL